MKKFNTAVILAGGKSIRMGFDKQLLSINKMRLINHLIKKLNDEFKEIIIVTNTPSYYENHSCKIISDEIKNKGPLSGIHAGLKTASSKYVYVLACDMPNVNLEYIRFMKNKINDEKANACITKLGKEYIEPFNAFYSKTTLKEIENNLLNGKKSIHSYIERINTLYIEEKEARKFSPNWDMFFNLNTKEDLGKYHHLKGL